MTYKYQPCEKCSKKTARLLNGRPLCESCDKILMSTPASPMEFDEP